MEKTEEMLLEQGCLDIWIDEIVPCLRDTETGEIKDTVVFKIESRAYLKKFTKKAGWHINWAQIPKDVEVYAWLNINFCVRSRILPGQIPASNHP